MSGESLLHIRLVEGLIKHVRATHRPPRGLLMLADHRSFGADRPPSIEGFFPDLFASDLPATFEILGEAKTPGDLETERSARQLAGFLDYLALRPSSTLYLMVPPFSRARATTIISRLRRPEHGSVTVKVLDGI